ncbi:MAG: response regulator, partial [Gammaproteobacteria bacterium]|nr:response regulator [Gammaproteobacteria bacterium]
MNARNEIWVVDDDRSIRWVLEKALQQAEMNVTGFESGRGVMERLERERPDAILTDVRMPDVNGFELLEGIVARYPNLPVII